MGDLVFASGQKEKTLTLQLRPGPIGNLVVIGVGDLDWIPALIHSPAEYILCFEPHPLFASPLQAAADPDVNLTHMACIVDTLGGTRDIPLTNVSHIALLEQTDSLKEVFPGLEINDMMTIQAQTPADVLALCPVAEAPSILCLNTLGVGGQEIGHLIQENDGVRPFSDIYIRACTNPAVAPGHSEEGLKALLQSNDYVFSDTAVADPDFPVLHFVEDRLAEKLIRARREIHALKNAHATAVAAAHEHKQAAKARSERLVELSEELAEAQVALAVLKKPTKSKRATPRKTTVQKD